jgi:hypothetical protein
MAVNSARTGAIVDGSSRFLANAGNAMKLNSIDSRIVIFVIMLVVSMALRRCGLTIMQLFMVSSLMT